LCTAIPQRETLLYWAHHPVLQYPSRSLCPPIVIICLIMLCLVWKYICTNHRHSMWEHKTVGPWSSRISHHKPQYTKQTFFSWSYSGFWSVLINIPDYSEFPLDTSES
jgi:hypothetical protein